jgi:hypothetical protein
VSGGLPPYTYQWFKNGVSVGVTTASYQECFSWNGYGGGSYQFTLRVDVRDAQNTLVSASKTVTAYNSGGGMERVSENSKSPQLLLPEDFSVSQNFPNPFNPETEITFGLPERSTVKITILDLLGREVMTLTNAEYRAGYQRVRWDGTDSNGNKIGSGIYFYRITATSESGKQFAKVMKMALTK